MPALEPSNNGNGKLKTSIKKKFLAQSKLNFNFFNAAQPVALEPTQRVRRGPGRPRRQQVDVYQNVEPANAKIVQVVF